MPAYISLWTKQWAEERGLSLHFTESCPSTNDLAKENAVTADRQYQMKLYLTSQQNRGRGRLDRSWIGAENSLLSSWSFQCVTNVLPVTTARVGLALIRSLDASFPFLPWSLKAPNDLFLANKKVAGILVEMVSMGQETRLIVGLGLNANSHPSELPEATSISENLPAGVTLQSTDWKEWLDRWYTELKISVKKSHQPLSIAEANTLTTYLNRRPSLNSRILSVEPDGTLLSAQGRTNWIDQ